MGIYKTWLNRINDNDISHAQAVNFGHNLVGRGKRSNMSEDEMKDVLYHIHALHPQIKMADVRIGLKWLRSLAHTETGKTRLHNPFDSEQLHILSGADAMGLIGYYEHNDTYRPVYRVYSLHGWFDYLVTETRVDAMVHGHSKSNPLRILGTNYTG